MEGNPALSPVRPTGVLGGGRRRATTWSVVGLSALALVVVSPGAGPAQAYADKYRVSLGALELVTKNPRTGALPNGASGSPRVSPSGRYAFLTSYANNLTTRTDIRERAGRVFRIDLQTGATVLVSTDEDDQPMTTSADAWDVQPLSDDVALFTAWGADFVAGTPSTATQVYRKDLASGAVDLISATADGTPANDSMDLCGDVSGNGRFVLLCGRATNFPGGGNLHGRGAIWRKDLQTGAVALVARELNGAFLAAAAISHDGTQVAYSTTDESTTGSESRQLLSKKLTTGAVTVVSSTGDGTASSTDVFAGLVRYSPDGRTVWFSADTPLDGDPTHGGDQVYAKALATGQLTVLSRREDGTLPRGEAALEDVVGTWLLISQQDVLSGPTHLWVLDPAAGSRIQASTLPNGAQSFDVGYAARASLSPNAGSVLIDIDYGQQVLVKNLATGALVDVDTTETGERSDVSPSGTRFAGNRHVLLQTTVTAGSGGGRVDLAYRKAILPTGDRP